ncbi:sensor histidine kinase [Paenibacillus sp. KN14-4R]|uniref:sensor histidine kinase n=1 Tax=Paenibacillus sp. KN14-4R TaxID=3445773 RepID=UPI003F9FF896
MKLKYHLYLAFGSLLLCVLVVTAIAIYPLLFDTLIQNQRNQMRSQGSNIMNNIAQLTEGAPVLAEHVQRAGTATEQTVISAALALIEPTHILPLRISTSQSISNGLDMLRMNMEDMQNFLQDKINDDKYIVETFGNYRQPSNVVSSAPMLVLSTPISEIKVMQQALFNRMMLILSIGGVIAFLISMLITNRIVTPLAKLKEELKKVKNRQFSDVQWVKSSGEIGEVSRSVCELATELGSYNQAQKQFFQNASHELKTPLMSIQGYAEGIRDGIFTGEQASKGLDIIANECERLKRVVTEMTLLAKLESEDGIFQPSDVDVPELLNETVERVSPLLIQQGLEIKILYNIEYRSKFHIQADHEKLLQALLNIVGNAIRHAKHQIVIYVSKQDSSIKIEVTDDGAGIPNSLLPHLFQRFIKGNNGETGLGLAISRAIVERCRGEITAHNLASGGASFVMRFPSAGSSQAMLFQALS